MFYKFSLAIANYINNVCFLMFQINATIVIIVINWTSRISKIVNAVSSITTLLVRTLLNWLLFSIASGLGLKSG